MSHTLSCSLSPALLSAYSNVLDQFYSDRACCSSSLLIPLCISPNPKSLIHLFPSCGRKTRIPSVSTNMSTNIKIGGTKGIRISTEEGGNQKGKEMGNFLTNNKPKPAFITATKQLEIDVKMNKPSVAVTGPNLLKFDSLRAFDYAGVCLINL